MFQNTVVSLPLNQSLYVRKLIMAQREIPPFPLSHRGFTLTEILVVVAIFSILAAIAVPNWSTLLPTYALNSAARQVQSGLNNIKSQAAARNASYRLSFSTTSYIIQKDDGSGWQDTGESRSLPEGITIASTSASTLGFTSRATATPGTGGTVRLCNAKNAGKNIVVSSTGRIRIENATC